MNVATLALILGHASRKYVHDTNRRYRPKDQSKGRGHLPDPRILPEFSGDSALMCFSLDPLAISSQLVPKFPLKMSRKTGYFEGK